MAWAIRANRRVPRLADLAGHPHRQPGRLPQPPDRADPLGLELRDPRPRLAPDHGRATDPRHRGAGAARMTTANPGESPELDAALVIDDNETKRRYEARLGGELAGWVDYGRVRSRLVALHTEVLPEYEGR